ncbi:unnamed protein product [Spirodela intermedia]|uniref:F-box domain-containing protein n=1 Tax=Spirodela intermedia TaxID=51605 RepID=A0A7I8JSN3_SPIIN|nr:unnamed protein product [Spirodela intermedia]CAA6672761.1 unnamed protein product [Spirodela intermedia]
MDDTPLPRTAAALATPSGSRTVPDVGYDALTHCAAFLGMRDLARMAMTCKLFRQVAYSDSIWRRLFRESWPQNFIPLEASGARAAYLARNACNSTRGKCSTSFSAGSLPTLFQGHNVPVTTLADGLLGKSGTKLLASGGEDGSVRLWSFSSSGKRQPLVATLHGHERPISFLTVAGAMLWDVRMSSAAEAEAEPVATLDGHVGRVAAIHADRYKVVTGGPDDLFVKVWEADTGAPTNSLECCCSSPPAEAAVGLSAMAEPQLLCFRDYSNSSVPMTDREQGSSSKFWEEPSSSSDDRPPDPLCRQSSAEM